MSHRWTQRRPDRKTARKNAGLFLIFPLLVLSAWAKKPKVPAHNSFQLAAQISVRVELVVVPVTVTERNGQLAAGLKKDNFQIYEDGRPQDITLFEHEDVPVTVGLVVDNSGSMKRKRPEVIAASGQFAEFSNPKDEIFVIHFDDVVTEGLPEDVPFTSDVVRIKSAVASRPTAGMTTLYDGILVALEHLKKGSHDKKALVVISDGGDNASQHNFRQVMEMAQRNNAIIYTVGIFDADDPDRNPRVLKQLAGTTGGRAFFPTRLEDTPAIMRQIAKELREQYTLGYIPSNRKHDGTYRTIRVAANSPDHKKLVVRTRQGYYAPSEPPPEQTSSAPARLCHVCRQYRGIAPRPGGEMVTTEEY